MNLQTHRLKGKGARAALTAAYLALLEFGFSLLVLESAFAIEGASVGWSSGVVGTSTWISILSALSGLLVLKLLLGQTAICGVLVWIVTVSGAKLPILLVAVINVLLFIGMSAIWYGNAIIEMLRAFQLPLHLNGTIHVMLVSSVVSPFLLARLRLPGNALYCYEPPNAQDQDRQRRD